MSAEVPIRLSLEAALESFRKAHFGEVLTTAFTRYTLPESRSVARGGEPIIGEVRIPLPRRLGQEASPQPFYTPALCAALISRFNFIGTGVALEFFIADTFEDFQKQCDKKNPSYDSAWARISALPEDIGVWAFGEGHKYQYNLDIEPPKRLRGVHPYHFHLLRILADVHDIAFTMRAAPPPPDYYGDPESPHR